jgi:hypothetical protein
MVNLIAFLIFLGIFVSLGISQLNDLREFIRRENNPPLPRCSACRAQLTSEGAACTSTTCQAEEELLKHLFPTPD